MNQFLYLILRAFSKLPMRVLFGISNVLYFIIHYIVRYREEVVLYNLKNSFPEKSDKEIKKIHKQFNLNFTDYIVELVKIFDLTNDEITSKMKFTNLEILDVIKSEQKNIACLTGHVFNWEFFTNMSTRLNDLQTYAVFHKARNPFWNKKICDLRSKFGGKLIEMKKTRKTVLGIPNDGKSLFLFIGDQSPRKDKVKKSIQFLNQATPYVDGYEDIAIEKNHAVIYTDVKKVKRGYYEVDVKRIMPDGEYFVKGEMIRKYYDLLSDTLHKDPSNWLWNHKRWKHGSTNTSS